MSGTYNLPIYESQSTETLFGEGVPYTSPLRYICPFTRMGLYPPKLMEEWEITKIYLPIGVGVAAEVAGEHEGIQTATVNLTLELFRNGELVWSKTVEGKLYPIKAKGLLYVFNTNITEDLINPIKVSTAQTLQIRATAVIYNLGKVSATIFLASYAESQQEAKAVGSSGLKEGRLTYLVNELTGHRRL